MTAPAIWPGTDLDSIVFSNEEPGSDCVFQVCSAQATHLGVFGPVVECGCPGDKPYCLAHRDQILACAADNDHLFRCPDCPGSVWRLLRMGPLR
jgi:hypothetical protein